MDQQLESLNLEDGGIGIEFEGGEQEVITSECSFNTHEESGMDHEIELGQVGEENAMDTDAEVIDNVQYVQTQETSNNDMPILDETVLTEPIPQVQISIETSPVLTQTAQIVEAKKVTPPATAPKTSRVAVSQAYRIGGKPISIAPKPITMSNSGLVNLRKYSIAGVQSRALDSSANVSGDIGGRQVVVVPTSGNRFKMVGTPLRATTPVQIQVRQRTVPPLTKLTIPAGKDGSSGIVTVQKTPARFISIPSQQVGLLGGKITQLVAVSPTKQPLATSTPIVRPIRQSFNTVKSPTKILPAPQGVTGGNKVILTAAPQSIVVRPSAAKPGQVMKVDGSTILASIPAGQKINPQQIHQINIPGKGIQYVRLVPAPGLANQAAASATAGTVQTQPQIVTTTPAAISQNQAVLTTNSAKIKPVQPQLLPKTFLITDFKHNNMVQMVPGKGKSIINTSAPGSSNIKKIFSKPAKIAPASNNSQILAESQQNIKIIKNSDKSIVNKMIKSEAIVTPDEEYVADNEIVSNIEGPQEVDGKQNMNTESEIQHQEVVNNEVNEEDELNNMEEIVEHSCEEMVHEESISVSDPLNVVMMQGSYIQMQQDSHQNVQRLQENDVKEELSEYPSKIDSAMEFGMRPRKPCNCTKSQCLKLYCDCFANGEFCNQCNCNNCYNNLGNEEYRQKAIRSCLERNPNAFRPKIGKAKSNVGLDVVRRHNKGCNCKRSGCLKNYCECYEGKIACSANCKCVGCRNVEDAIDKKILRRSRVESVIGLNSESFNHNNSHLGLSNSGGGGVSKCHKQESVLANTKSPCNMMTNDVIQAVCQCLIAQAADAESAGMGALGGGGARKVLEEFAYCLQDIISAAQQHKSAASLL